MSWLVKKLPHNKVMRYSAATVILLILAAITSAQFDMSSMQRLQYSPCMAINRPDVRKELKLTKDQAKQVDQIEKDMYGALRPKNGQNDPNSLAAP